MAGPTQHTLCGWEGTPSEALARLVLLPAVWTSPVAKPDVLSKVEKFGYKWRKGEVGARGKE